MLVMKIEGLVSGAPSPFDGQYLMEYDPDRRGVDPSGVAMLAHVRVTPDKAKAAKFPSLVEFQETWARVSSKWPVRPDGEPNRPLTAFSVSTESVESPRKAQNG